MLPYLTHPPTYHLAPTTNHQAALLILLHDTFFSHLANIGLVFCCKFTMIFCFGPLICRIQHICFVFGKDCYTIRHKLRAPLPKALDFMMSNWGAVWLWDRNENLLCTERSTNENLLRAASLLCTESPTNDSLLCAESVPYAQSDPLLVCVATPTGMTLLSAWQAKSPFPHVRGEAGRGMSFSDGYCDGDDTPILDWFLKIPS